VPATTVTLAVGSTRFTSYTTCEQVDEFDDFRNDDVLTDACRVHVREHSVLDGITDIVIGEAWQREHLNNERSAMVVGAVTRIWFLWHADQES
jgi:hypothetical protein